MGIINKLEVLLILQDLDAALRAAEKEDQFHERTVTWRIRLARDGFLRAVINDVVIETAMENVR